LNPRQSLRRLLQLRATAWVILVLSFAITALAWWISATAIQAKAAQRFGFQTQDIAASIVTRLLIYETALRSGVGLFNASQDVTRDEWRQYVSDLRLQQNFPGIQGLCFSLMLAPEARERHLAAVRAEGFPDYVIRPEGDRETYSAIVYLEPFDWRNQRAFGYDMFSEPVPRAAMERARDSGEAAISGRVILVQETQEDVQYGFFMYLPVYRKNMPVATVDERRAALMGFVYSPFRVKDFLRGILDVDQGGIGLELFDGETPAPETLLLDDIPNLELHALRMPQSPGQFAKRMRIPVGQRVWNLYVHTLPGYLSGAETAQPLIVALGGVVLDLFLFGIVASVSRRQRHAERQSVRLREELFESESRYGALFQSARAVMLLIDAETGAILDANPAAANFYGYNLEQMRRMRISDINQLPPDDIRAEMAQALEARRECFLFPHRLASGEIRQVEVRSGPFPYHGKRALYSIIQDVTERKRIEQALQDVQNRLALAIRASGIGIWDFDVIHRTSIWDDGMFRLYGITPNACDGTYDDWQARLHPDDRARCTLEIGKAFCGEQEFNTEFRVLWPDGSIHHIRALSVVQRDAAGQAMRMIGTNWDITSQKDNEARLAEARQHAEAANVAKSSFLATMSHEIRTPINGVIGSVDLLVRTPLDPTQMELVETIRDSSTGLLRIIDNILDFSKIEAGRLELEYEPMSPRRLVEAACYALQPLAAERGVTLALFTDPRLPAEILGDSVRLRQILNNLLSNAIKFASGQARPGQVRLRAELNEGASSWQITVSDNGIGMTPEAQTKLFSPFVQAETSTTRRFGGTGLGLSIARRLVELFGGQIEVESEPERGTTFRITLPFESYTAGGPPGSALAGLTCLVMAREEERALDWCRYLEHAGARAESFRERDAAVQHLARFPPEQAILVLEEARNAAQHWYREQAGVSLPALVIVDRDRRRAPRLLSPGLVLVDGAVLTCDALVAAIGIAAGRREPEMDAPHVSAVNAAFTPPDRASAIAQGRLILVAEDNPVNQKVIRRQLTMLGFAADLVENGQEALMAWRRNEYGALITDLHMPEMDGYTLATAIRAEEDGARHLPIIALSANVLKEAAERCRAVGMDDYLSKPAVLEQLMAVLGQWFTPSDGVPPPPIAPESSDAPTESVALDADVLAQLIGDAPDPDLLVELLADFTDSAEQGAAQIRAAVSAADWEAVCVAADQLKSACFSIGALPLGDCCNRIEQAGKAGDGATIAEWMRTFENRLAAVRAEGRNQPAASPPEPLTLDERVLAQLIGGDTDLLVELLTDFWNTAEQGLERMQAAIAAADWETVGSVAHGLKSASFSIGAFPFGDCCKLIEQAGRAGDGTTIVEWMGVFETRLAAVLSAIENR
jgi:PAS domain S-box-containing protein